MTIPEFLSAIKTRGAILSPGISTGKITLINSTLQQMRSAMLPKMIQDLYTTCGGIILDGGYIFGPTEQEHTGRTPVPDIISVNRDFSGLPNLAPKTIFGRNDLFIFAFDAFGTFYMLDNLTLRPLRKYQDGIRALTDCLIAGKF